MSKAERYNKGELDKVQQIPKQKPKVEKQEEEDEPMFQPTSEEIQKMLAKTKQTIEEKKKALNIVTPQPVLTHKEQQLAALRASIASKKACKGRGQSGAWYNVNICKGNFCDLLTLHKLSILR